MASSKVSVTVKYSKPGAQPPIYLAGSFSDPPWQPEEMEHNLIGDNEYAFRKEVGVEEGKEYQYKFRLGEGDWWTLEENSPTVTDDIGNRNNLLVAPKAEQTQSESMKAAQPAKDTVERATNLKTISECDDERPEVKSADAKKYTHQESDSSMSEPAQKAGSPTIPTIALTTNMEKPSEPTPTPALELDKKLEHDEEETKKVLDAFDAVLAKDVTHASLEQNKAETTETSMAIKQKDEVKAESGKYAREKTDTSGVIHEGRFAPLVVPEKVNSESHHTNNVDDPAIVDQRAAHLLRSDDLTNQRSSTPGIADTAAEVADSAAVLDLDEPSPIISDEEAGRIGLRRMSQTPTPEVVATATEVAESAAELERGQPNPSISDKETGRSGFQHLSETSNHEVADTADEVADIAATLDKEEDTNIDFGGPPSPLDMDFRDDVDYDSPLIPGVNVGPLLSHERLREKSERLPPTLHTFFDYSAPSKDESALDDAPPMTPEEQRAVFDRFQKLQKKFYPNGMTNMSDEEPEIYFTTSPQQRLKTPSPHFSAQGRSPSLDSITEEDDEREEQAEIRALPALSSTISNSTNGHCENEMPKLVEHKDEIRNSGVTREQSTSEIFQSANQLPCIPALRLDGMDIVDELPGDTFKALTDAPVSVGSSAKDQDSNHDNTASDCITDSSTMEETLANTSKNKKPAPVTTLVRDIGANTTTIDTSKNIDLFPGTKGTTFGETAYDDDATDKCIKIPEPINAIKVLEIHPDSPSLKPSNISLGGLGAYDWNTVPAVVTPFVISKRGLGQENADQVKDQVGEDGSPLITILPPTPAPSITNKGGVLEIMKPTNEIETPPKPVDTAKTSSIEPSTEDTQLQPRKQPKRIPSPERPITPSSMRSAGKDAKSRNFFKAFWHVVFVDFFGGLLMKCFGGDRKRNT